MDHKTPTVDEISSGGIGILEKWLSVWIALYIAAGIGLGAVIPDLF